MRFTDVSAVVVDLDDTLYPQSAYLVGAASAVGAAASAAGLDGPAIEAALQRILAAGSDRGGTIDRALLACGIPAARASAVMPALVAGFTAHQPATLDLYPGAVEALAALRERYPVACLTDGTPTIQRAKLAATNLGNAFDAIIVTDELGGRRLRKPHPAGLQAAAKALGVPADQLVMIGDRPAKDVAAAHAVGARAIRVRTGEYAHAANHPAADAVVDSFATAVELLD